MYGYLRPLAYFAHVVDTGSITAAANRLGVSPSVVSESVKTLVSHLGEPLLERRRNGVLPTPRGVALASEASAIVNALERAIRPESSERSIEGKVSISLPGELAAHWFDKAWQDLRRDHPGISITLWAEDEMADHTKYARDLYVRVSNDAEAQGLSVLAQCKVRVARVGSSDLLAGLPDNSPETIGQLPFIAPAGTGSQVTLPLRTRSKPTSVRFHRLLRVNDIVTRVSLARKGLGLVGCLAPTVEADLASGALTEVFPGQVGPPDLQVRIGSPHRRPPAKAKLVAEALARYLPA